MSPAGIHPVTCTCAVPLSFRDLSATQPFTFVLASSNLEEGVNRAWALDVSLSATSPTYW